MFGLFFYFAPKFAKRWNLLLDSIRSSVAIKYRALFFFRTVPFISSRTFP